MKIHLWPCSSKAVAVCTHGALVLFMTMAVLKCQQAVADGPALAASRTDHRHIRIITLDQAGKPVAGVNVHVGIWSKDKKVKPKRDYTTSAQGLATVELPGSFYILRIWASKESFATLFAA